MKNVINTIIGWVMETDEGYKIYNPRYWKWSKMSKEQFEALNVGNFPYFKQAGYYYKINNDIVEFNDRVYLISNGKALDFETGKYQKAPEAPKAICKYVPAIEKYFAYNNLGNDEKAQEIIELVKGENINDNDGFRETCDKLMNAFMKYRSYLNKEWYKFYKGMIRYFIMVKKIDYEDFISRFPNVYEDILDC